MTREDVIRQIVKRDIQKQGLTEETVVEEARELHEWACEHFGVWETALQYAGVNLSAKGGERLLGPEQVQRELRRLCTKPSNLRSSWNRRKDPKLYRAAVRHFGSWEQALVATGINTANAGVRRRAVRLNKRQVVEAIFERNRRGQPMRWVDVCMDDQTLALSAKRCFENWRKAVSSAGVISEEAGVRSLRKWNRQTVIAAIHARHEQGLPMTGVKRNDSPLLLAARTVFGTWHEALTAAGLVGAGSLRIWNRSRVLVAIQARHNQGLPLTGIWKDDPVLACAAKRLYGSWSQAVKAAGCKPATRRWNKQLVIEAIQARHREGLPLRGVYNDDLGLCGAARLHFGSWRAAMAAAGFEARRPGQKWTEEKIIETLRELLSQEVSIEQIWNDHPNIESAARRYFGGRQAALEAVKLADGAVDGGSAGAGG